MKYNPRICSSQAAFLKLPIIRQMVLCFCAFAMILPGLQASEKSAAATAKSLLNLLKEKGWNVRDTYTTGLLRRGQHVVVKTTLEKGNKYQLVVGGCDDATDIDIEVYDENDELVSKDESKSVLSVAKITPKWSGEYKIKVIMFDSTPDGAHYVLQYAWARVE